MARLAIIHNPTIPCYQMTLIMNRLSLWSFVKKTIFTGKKPIICNVKTVIKEDKT